MPGSPSWSCGCAFMAARAPAERAVTELRAQQIAPRLTARAAGACWGVRNAHAHARLARRTAVLW
jgi:hypothetical protein